jgi:hypothetical protein
MYDGISSGLHGFLRLLLVEAFQSVEDLLHLRPPYWSTRSVFTLNNSFYKYIILVSFLSLFVYNNALIIFKTNAHIFILVVTYFPTKIHIFVTN